jgi:hypothetical protein
MGKIKTVLKEGVFNVADAYQEGFKNYQNPKHEIEMEAKRRALVCKDCLIDEPISFLRVEDERIPELSNKIFSCCGCAAPYKARQNKIKCEKWDV